MRPTEKNSTKRLTLRFRFEIFNHMVEQTYQLDALFRALADPTRRSMLIALRTGERSVGQLAEPFEISLAGASKHVQVLERSKLIQRRKVGRTWYCSINKDAILAAQKWIQEYSDFWNSNLDKLHSLLEQEQEESDEE